MPPIPQPMSTNAPTPEPKSPATGLMIALFAVVVLGMIAQYVMFALNDASRAKESVLLSVRMASVEKAVSDLASRQAAAIPAVVASAVVPSIAVEPLVYGDLGSDISVKVEKITFPFTAADLMSRASDCGTGATQAHIDSVVSMFQGVQATRYTFHYLKPSQGGDYTVLVVPNSAEYASLDAFKKDFDICSAGGVSYPTKLTANNLLFVSSCGTGFDDGSGRPNGCSAISQKIESTLSIQ